MIGELLQSDEGNFEKSTSEHDWKMTAMHEIRKVLRNTLSNTNLKRADLGNYKSVDAAQEMDKSKKRKQTWKGHI